MQEKETGANMTPSTREALLEEERFIALTRVAREHATPGGQVIPLAGKQATCLTPQTHITAQGGNHAKRRLPSCIATKKSVSYAEKVD